MTAERISHSISSNGSMPSRVKKRSNSRPGAPAGAVPGVRAIACGVVLSSDPAELGPARQRFSAYFPSERGSPPSPRRDPNEQVISVLRYPVPVVFVSDALRRCPALQLRALGGSQVRMTRGGTLSLRYDPVKTDPTRCRGF